MNISFGNPKIPIVFLFAISVTIATQNNVHVKTKIGEISKKKCVEYSLKPRVWYISEAAHDPGVVPCPSPVDLILAPWKPPSKLPLIPEPYNNNPPPPCAAGGVDAFPAQFPHMAILGYEEKTNITWQCGGSLISEKYVLTAGHCINTRIGPVKYVRVGDLNTKLLTDNAKPQDFGVARTIIHPAYKGPSIYNDIALIELSRNAVFSDYVQPACLQTEVNITEHYWRAAGWGFTSEGGEPANHLQHVPLRSFTLEECQAVYSSVGTRKLKNGVDSMSQICAGGLYKDTCRGDSGGPLQVWTDDMPGGQTIVIGVTTFGKACGVGESPSIYTRVSHYIEWIESIVWP